MPTIYSQKFFKYKNWTIIKSSIARGQANEGQQGHVVICKYQLPSILPAIYHLFTVTTKTSTKFLVSSLQFSTVFFPAE